MTTLRKWLWDWYSSFDWVALLSAVSVAGLAFLVTAPAAQLVFELNTPSAPLLAAVVWSAMGYALGMLLIEYAIPPIFARLPQEGLDG